MRGRERVRPRVELFVDAIVAGLDHDDWSLFDADIGARTLQLLKAGTVSADDLNGRAATLAAILLPHVAQQGGGPEVVMALFRMMQSLSGSIIARHNATLLEEARRLGDVQAMFLRLTGHELQAPLGAIRGYASMLAEGDFGALPEAARSAATSIDSTALAALELIDGLVEVGRLEGPGELLHRRPVKLRELVEAPVAALAAAAAARGMRFQASASDAVAVVDVERCLVAIRNLAANAIKYGPPDSVITIKASIESGVVLIEVSDEGPGIPASESERVFERYYRLQPSRRANVTGSGLGLYIVKRIAELHGGSADVVGARFRVRLPSAF